MIERDEARMVTWVDGVPMPDEEVRRMTKPNDSQARVRDDVAANIHAALAREENVRRIDEPDVQTGPLGGLSARVRLWLEADGDLYPVVVSVYCDDRVEESLLADIEAERRERERRDRVRRLVLGEEEPSDSDE